MVPYSQYCYSIIHLSNYVDAPTLHLLFMASLAPAPAEATRACRFQVPLWSSSSTWRLKPPATDGHYVYTYIYRESICVSYVITIYIDIHTVCLCRYIHIRINSLSTGSLARPIGTVGDHSGLLLACYYGLLGPIKPRCGAQTCLGRLIWNVGICIPGCSESTPTRFLETRTSFLSGYSCKAYGLEGCTFLDVYSLKSRRNLYSQWGAISRYSSSSIRMHGTTSGDNRPPHGFAKLS